MGLILAVTPGATQPPAGGSSSLSVGRGEKNQQNGPRLLIRTPSRSQVHLRPGAPTPPTSCAAEGTELWGESALPLLLRLLEELEGGRRSGD